jgi:hypothetical protein
MAVPRCLSSMSRRSVLAESPSFWEIIVGTLSVWAWSLIFSLFLLQLLAVGYLIWLLRHVVGRYWERNTL